MEDKNTLRRFYSHIRENIPDRSGRDRLIVRNILELKKFSEADTVLLYASFRSEPDTAELTRILLKSGIRPAFPKCFENSDMKFFHICSPDDLVPGKFGISEPSESCREAVYTDRTVCIVPGLAFTELGGRLGHGGGFYDRFLQKNSGIFTIAPVYEALIAQELPLLEHDIKMDMIVTEERKVSCDEQ